MPKDHPESRENAFFQHLTEQPLNIQENDSTAIRNR